MIITSEITGLVETINQTNIKDHITKQLHQLIKLIKIECERPENQTYYKKYLNHQFSLGKYPIDAEGYAVSFDPIAQEKEFKDAFARYGMVVGKGVIDRGTAQNAVQEIQRTLHQTSKGKFDINKPLTYNNIASDKNNTPLLSRGFFEVYHSQELAQIRQSIRLYLHHVLIWGRHDLWTSFDRYGVKLPGHKESGALGLHVDQNPTVHPDFKTIQGILALVDCPLERGTFVGVPGSIGSFKEYTQMVKNQGEYVELDGNHTISGLLESNKQAIPLRACDIVSRDSRMTHANSANISDKTRMVAMVAAGPVPSDDILTATKVRNTAFITGEGSNVRNALMHASKKPRYSDNVSRNAIRNPEQLTILGELLYGQKSYNEI